MRVTAPPTPKRGPEPATEREARLEQEVEALRAALTKAYLQLAEQRPFDRRAA